MKPDHSPSAELSKKLSPKAIAAFKKLCDLGCNRDYLDFQLKLIDLQEVIIPPQVINLEIGGIHKTGGNNFTFHFFDDWKEALGRRNLADLRQIAARAKRLKKEIEELRKTELVRSLVQDGTLPKGDLLAGSQLKDTTKKLDGLIALPDIVKRRFSRKSVDRTTLRIDLAKHIREKTGDWQDRLRATLLLELLPHNPNRPISAKSEYRWRKRQKLID
jgi:hypothetical protein